jgi:hypothetical protein
MPSRKSYRKRDGPTGASKSHSIYPLSSVAVQTLAARARKEITKMLLTQICAISANLQDCVKDCACVFLHATSWARKRAIKSNMGPICLENKICHFALAVALPLARETTINLVGINIKFSFLPVILSNMKIDILINDVSSISLTVRHGSPS